MSGDSNFGVARNHFSSLVPKWSHYGPPLRPSPDDTAVVRRHASGLADGSRVVVLGLTPEIIGGPWPEATDLIAIDHSGEMIRRLWPSMSRPLGARVVRGDWLNMPVPAATVDLVAGDGCFIVLAYPDGFKTLTSEVRRILKPGGRFLIRVFIRPSDLERPDAVARAVERNEVSSVHALKLRLLAAVHGLSGAGARLDDVWRAWKAMPPFPGLLRSQRGWTSEEIVGIESYRGLETRYFLPTFAEFREAVSPGMVETECSTGRYELGERCPTFVLERREP